MKENQNGSVMRKLLYGGSVALLLPVGFCLAGILGSAHDFSGRTWNTGGEICMPCHTPHSGSLTLGAPLWNHEVTAATFTPYSSPTLNATVPEPSDSSKACLSCHDGTVAIDSFGGNVGTEFNTGRRNLGTDLSNDHPVSFVFNTALATDDGELFDPSVTTIPSLPGSPTIDEALLLGGKVECASCHDVHANKGDAGDNHAMLVIDNAASALCLTCHDK